MGFPDSSIGKESACNAGDPGSIPGLGRSPGEGKGYPLQYSGLENSMDCIAHGVANSQGWLSDSHFHFSNFMFKGNAWGDTRRWALGIWLAHVGRALMNEINTLIIETPKSSSPLLPLWRHCEKMAVCQLESRLSSVTAGAWILAF